MHLTRREKLPTQTGWSTLEMKSKLATPSTRDILTCGAALQVLPSLRQVLHGEDAQEWDGADD